MTVRTLKLGFTILICLLLHPVTANAAAPSSHRDAPAFSKGELVYCPVYPSIYHMGQKKGLDLTVTLSIHNISPDSAITVESVEYYSKKGKLLSRIVEAPLKLAPLETATFVLNPRKQQGGVGANSLIRWRAEKAVSRPLIQAVMITTSGSQGISFITEGVPVKTLE